jgi:hypothetical protein
MMCKIFYPDGNGGGSYSMGPIPIQDFETTLTWDPANPSED